MSFTGRTKYFLRQKGQPLVDLFVCGAQLELVRFTCCDKCKQ
jgi:hypothetical protein